MVVTNVRQSGQSLSPNYGSNLTIESTTRSKMGTNLPPSNFNFNFPPVNHNQSPINFATLENNANNSSGYTYEFNKRTSTGLPGAQVQMQFRSSSKNGRDY